MLQPVELQDVSARFADSIGNLRHFLSLASIPVGDASAAHAVAVRIGSDRSFHRDLMSHIWVVLDESSQPPRYADLLGIVAIAAAGVRGAAETDEHDAHALLRFLMEAKHTLEGTPTPLQAGAPAQQALNGHEGDQRPLGWTAPDASERRRMPSHFGTDLPSAAASPRTPSRAPALRQNRRALVMAGAALCFAVALLLGYFALQRPSATSGDGAVAVKPSATVDKAPAGAVFLPQPESAPSSGRDSTSGTNGRQPGSPLAQRAQAAVEPRSSVQPKSPTASPFARQAEALGTAPAPPAVSISRSLPAAPPPVPPTVNAFAPAASAVPAPVATGPAPVILRPSRSGAAVPSAVPANTLTARLDSPRLPAYASDAEEGKGRSYPRLLRRHAAGAVTGSASDPGLSAELRAPDLSGMPASSRQVPAASHAVVHSTCVGMMAANLVYSPTPSYPVAAVSAHVQGEVKIQATIDRDGTVNAARVVSGPPLLRDAALDAVQHWRYKPYLAGGKPAPTGTMAVVNFELP